VPLFDIGRSDRVIRRTSGTTGTIRSLLMIIFLLISHLIQHADHRPREVSQGLIGTGKKHGTEDQTLGSFFCGAMSE